MLSIVIPCYNEEPVIGETNAQLTKAMESLDMPYEVIYVNDGSKDKTLPILQSIAAGDSRVKILTLSRNFGHQIAVSAGLDYAQGDAVVLIDADLQDPPEVILEMVAKWKEGYHVVYGQRSGRTGETAFKRYTAKKFYRIINNLSEIPIPLDTGDFRLMDRKVVAVLKEMPEHDRFVRGMVSWAGFKQTPLMYERHPRWAGESKYPLRKMIRFAITGIVSFSDKPLKLATYFGFLTAIFALMGIFVVIGIRLFTSTWVAGWATILVAVMFFSGVQLITLGIIGEYIGRTYKESKKRPLYIVEHEIGF